MSNKNDDNSSQNFVKGGCETKEIIFNNYEQIKNEALTIDLCNVDSACKNSSKPHNQHNNDLRNIILIIIILIFCSMARNSHKYGVC